MPDPRRNHHAATATGLGVAAVVLARNGSTPEQVVAALADLPPSDRLAVAVDACWTAASLAASLLDELEKRGYDGDRVLREVGHMFAQNPPGQEKQK